MSIVDRIKWAPLANDQYYREEVPKRTIFLHHTAGNPNPYAVLKWWNETPERVGTAFVIGGKPTTKDNWVDGDIIQAFSSKHWAYHLGLVKANMPPGSLDSKTLNAQAIAIEICNWGPVTRKNGKFVTYVNTILNGDEVVDLGQDYRGFRFWHKYTDAQLSSAKALCQYLGKTYNIPLGYKGDEMFELDMRCFEGESGVWTHTSCRQDKTDCSPQPNFVAMVRGLA